MAKIFRLFLGLLLLPACWAIVRAFLDALGAASEATDFFSAETVALLGGIVAFALAWAALPHPVRTYVLGHELTHALWGLLFGARPSNLRVGAQGGSVRLTKENVIITLAPYFFPFYTFVVILAALITYAFLRPLPYLPLWMFLVGFTWAFHVLFTLETLVQRQPDITLYGRVFSWTVIFLVNMATLLVWLVVTTPLTFAQTGGFLLSRLLSAYASVWDFFAACARSAYSWLSSRPS